MASLALPVLPLVLAIPVRCSDGNAVLDLRIAALGLGLLAVVAWLAILARLAEQAGDGRADVDRRTLVSGVVLVPLMLVELVASSVTLAVGCGDTREPLVWHLAIAAAVLLVATATGAARQASAS